KQMACKVARRSLCGIALGNPFQKYSSLKEKRPCTEPVLWLYTGLFFAFAATQISRFTEYSQKVVSFLRYNRKC
ncbi:hypothetical protein, partial [Ruminococcus callidus]|uniref:hypothetical protein n=1 Tax=Ruminococcus callidus TaxID=40519 RepID=UPI003995B27A